MFYRSIENPCVFVISLMLIVGLFIGEAKARDGAGKVTVGWSNLRMAFVGAGTANDEVPHFVTLEEGDLLGENQAHSDGEAHNSPPLRANTRFAAIIITYKVGKGISADEEAVDMAGGLVRVALPGWEMGTIDEDNPTSTNADEKGHYKHVFIQAETNGNREILYQTDGVAQNFDIDDKETVDALLDRVKIDLNSVKVELGDGGNRVVGGDDWSEGGTLTIILDDIEVGIPSRLRYEDESEAKYPYANYELTTSSRTKNGTLIKLDDEAQGSVRVGNILGTGIFLDLIENILDQRDKTQDREFTIEPANVYVGEKDRKFVIKYKAPGPMYSGSGFAPRDGSSYATQTGIAIAIPPGIQPIGPAGRDSIRVSGPGISFGTIHDDSNGTVAGTLEDNEPITAIALGPGELPDGVNKDQVITVRYTADVAADAPPAADDAKSSFTYLATFIQGETEQNATKITGGAIRLRDGSGTVEISPVAVSAGALRREVNITYTAATALDGYNIMITPNGLVIDSDKKKLQTNNASGYGYVSGDKPDRLKVSTNGRAIIWDNIDLKKGKTLKVKIRRVDVKAEPNEYPWDVWVGETDGLLAELLEKEPELSVVKLSGDPVRFEVEDDTTFPAGSMQTIRFKFTAEATPIRDGTVSLTIPAALGSAPTMPESKKAGQIKVEGPGVKKEHVTVSGRVVTLTVKKLALGESVMIIYGHDDKKGDQAVLGYMSGKYKVTGTFRASANTATRSVKPIEIELGKIGDGIGLTSKTQSPVTLSPMVVKAGSLTRNAIEVTFTAAGTMDSGHVALEIPDNWGAVQTDDPLKRNYVTTVPPPGGTGSISISEVYSEANGTRVVAKINKLARSQSFDFVYGGGNLPSSNGIDVQSAIGDGTASFMVLSDGDGDEVFAPVVSLFEQSARQKLVNPKQAGKILKGSDGVLKIQIDSAQDGTGSVAFKGDTTPVVRAADDNVQLVFIYTPTQTIENGELKFTVPGDWSAPQVGSTGDKGYTEVEGTGGLGSVSTTGNSLTVPIFILDKDQTITITYGAGSDDAGKVKASSATGDAAFKFAVKGHEDGNLVPIQPATLTVGSQASGKGTAVITPTGDTLHAGDANREIKVVYTAAGQMVAGQVRLTIPADWSAPTADSVTAMVNMDAATLTFTDQMIVVDSVNLLGGGTVTFTYTGTVQPMKAEDVKFAVASHGGLATDSFADVSGMDTMLTVDVQEARPGAGMAMVEPMIVQAGATGVNLTFTYTAVGQIDPPREFRVRVPMSWGTPSPAGTFVENKNTYSVVHKDSGGNIQSAFVTKLPPIGQEMVARVRIGGFHVEAGDQIQFIYENADAPATPEVSPFQFSFNNKGVEGNVQVRVQDSMPSALSLQSAGTVSADAGAMPLGITVGLADADGDAVAMETDTMVTLTSDSATGVFSMMAGEAGTASATVTIAGGDVSAMVYYTDSTAGMPTITATAPGLTSAEQDISVTGGVIEITSVMVSPTVAKDGATVTVTAMASAGQAPMATIESIVSGGTMVESPAGTYTRTDTLAAGTQEGTYSVSVSIGDVMMAATDMLTVDNTPPTVTVTAPESAMDGDTVMISATVTETGTVSSVTADVSELDSTQTAMVELAMGTDGSYSASHPISDDNAALNGAKTITVTATDAAGNMGTGTTSVELANTLSYTSTISAGQTLFHVPLDVEGLDTVANLKAELGDAVSLVTVYDTVAGTWNSRSDDVPITADLGMILVTTDDIEHVFEGLSWGGAAKASAINLSVGSNLVGLPVDAAGITNVSDLITVSADAISSITVSTGSTPPFATIAAAGDDGDGPVMGDAAYLVTATSDTTVPLLGDGWSNDVAGAAPVALSGYNVEGQTAVLDVNGAVVDELTGLAREGFRVKVKNLSTKAALSEVTSVEMAEGYNMTFVDLKAGHAARIGDVLEISADSPSPLIGVQPVRHIVTVEDVKSGILELEDLIAYEIPAETELLRNYPNPFNPETWIPYHLASTAEVQLTIYDINGALVRELDLGHQAAGYYTDRSKAAYWDGRNEFGETVASGIYFYHLSAGDYTAMRRMVILK